MLLADFPALDMEQRSLAEAYFNSDSEIGLFEYSYQNASKELREFFDLKQKQTEEDMKNHCISD